MDLLPVYARHGPFRSEGKRGRQVLEELRKRILESRALRKKVVGAALSVLGRTLKVCRTLDPMVCAQMDTFPEDFVFIIGIYGSRHPVILQNRKRGLYRVYESVEAVCQHLSSAAPAVTRYLSADRSDPSKLLEIRFKSVEAAWRVIIGQTSAQDAWARHELIIRGEIHAAMKLFRCIQRAQGYLYPHRIARRVLPVAEKLPVARWKVWLRLLHVKKRRVNPSQGQEE